MPDFVTPQLATLVGEAPSGGPWWHEMKLDGFRILARLDKGEATLFTRSGQDWTSRFPAIARAVEALPAKNAWLDGEATIVLPDGRTSFQALQNQTETRPDGQSLAYFVFDLLYLDGRDLRALPLEARKKALATLTGAPKTGPLRYSDHFEGDGAAFFAKACEAGLEGIVSKRRDGVHVDGRNGDWLKTKCVKRQELVIGGFTDAQGARKGVGALLVGFYEGDQLRYAGKVGTGFSNKSAAELMKRLRALARPTTPFSPPPSPLSKSFHWVSPTLLAEVSFTEMTSGGKLRHPSFQGLREDKPARTVTRERPAPAPVAAPPSKIVLSHPERVLYPDVGVTKRDLADYYEAVSGRMLPELRGRPLTLVRCPGGVAKCFYMKHAPAGLATTLRRISIRERTTAGEYLMVDSSAGLIELAQMSVLELHTWNSTETSLEAPDRMVFDLDPGPRVPWPAVVEAARAVRERLTSLGLGAFLKSTGGKGLHVVVPLVPGPGWDQNLAFSQTVAESLVRDRPTQYTTAMPKAGREKKILIDYLRNRRGSTSVASFSTRARPGAPVSTPLSWDELDDFWPERPFTVKSLPGRLKRLKNDPWGAYDGARRPLSVATP
jgi:bifunctional non-homologous end joining protein LigD